MGILDLEEFVSRESERVNQADALTQSLSKGADANPDDYAKALGLAAKTGVAASWAKEFKPQIEKQRKTAPDAISELVNRSPKTAAFLAQPDNASIAHDDIENMTKMERALSYIVNPVRSLAAGFVGMPADLVYGGLAAMFESASTVFRPPDSLLNVARGLTGIDIPDPLAESGKYFRNVQRQSKAQTDWIRGDLSKEPEALRSAYSGFESAGGMLPFIPFSLYTATAGPALSLMSGATAGKSYGEAREKGVESPTAFGFAASQGLIEYATERMPTRALIRNLGLNTPFVKTLVDQIWRENLGEQVATGLQDLNDWAVLNPEKPFTDYLAARPNAALQTFIATMVGTTVQTGAARGIDLAVNGQEHRRNKALFDALASTATDSKLRQRLPEKFREFVENATKDGPVREVLIPAEQFDKYFQTQEMDPAVVAGELGATNYQEARLANTDVAIPIGQFAEKIAATPHLAGLEEDLRLNPNELTAREAKANPEEFQKDLTARMEAVLEEQARVAPLDTAIQLITDNVQQQLEAAGMEPNTARDQATVMRGIAVLAQRAFPNMNPLQAASQAWARYGLQVQGPVTETQEVDVEGAREREAALGEIREGAVGRTPQRAVGGAIEDHIRTLTEATTGLTYKGKTYTKATLAEGRNVTLTGPEGEVTVKGNQIMNIEEVIPFDVPEGSEFIRKFFQSTKPTRNVLDLTSEPSANGQAAIRETIGKALGVEVRSDHDIERHLTRAGYTGVRFNEDAGGTPSTTVIDVGGAQFFQSAPTFFSQLTRSLKGAKQEKAPASDWLAIISKLPGVKAEEIEATGIKEFLQLRGKDQVTKAELIEFAEANGVQVEEVTLGDMADQDRRRAEIDAEIREMARRFKIEPDNFEDKLNALIAERDKMPPSRPTKFSNYTLPGGENYKELLLTLPEDQNRAAAARSARVKELIAERDELQKQVDAFRARGLRGDIERQLRNANVQIDLAMKESKDPNAFRSSHFDQPNILAHIRFNERTDADGNKVLFIEEIQSDWAQKGKREGFATNTNGWTAQLLSDPDAGFTHWQIKDADGNDVTKIVGGTQESAIRKAAEGIPTAPFVTDTKAWVGLSLKRMIRYAAENGFDRIAWTSGEQQAERYDLSKAVDSISWNSAVLNDNTVYVTLKGLKGVSNQDLEIGVTKSTGIIRVTDIGAPSEWEGKNLADVIGKDIADKILATDKGELKGEGLKVGGEGMKAFYDRIVPQVANDILKKLGGGKVGTVGLLGGKKTEAGWESTGGDTTARATTKIELDDDGTYAVLVRKEGEHDWFWDAVAFGLTKEQAEAQAEERRISFGRHPSTTQPGFDITDNLRDKVMQGQALFQGDGTPENARASIQISEDRKVTISLLENRNLSSFFHEAGHFYLEALGDFAAVEGASDQIKDDYQTILDFMGVKSRGEIKTEHHEKFARGFEQYLREGKAPSAGLRGVFQRFRAWLKLIYRQAKDLNVQINDEVREVFDRILATDQEIEFAKSQAESKPLFTDAKAAGMTDAEFALYSKATVDEIEEAKEKLQLELMREYTRALSKEYKAERFKVQNEVMEAMDREPVHIAIKALSAGKLDDGTPVKLNRTSINEIYGKEIANKLPKKILANSGNLDADSAASFFGFTSGDALIKALAELPPRATEIDRRVDAIMTERHGDIRTDGTIATKAQDALHNEQRAKVIRMELAALRRRQGLVQEVQGPIDRARQVGARGATQVPPTKFFRDAARDIINHIAVRNLEPFRYLQAEKKSAREAFKAMAAEDFDLAAEAKQKELLSHYLYREATDAKADAEAILKYARKFDTAATRQAMGKAGADYLAQIDALLNRYEFRKVPIVQLEKRQALSEWIAQEEAAGRTPVIDQRLVDESRRQNYKDVSIDELRAVRDAMRNIEHLARLKNKLAYKQKQIEFADAKAELIGAAVTNIGETLQLYSESARPLSDRAAQLVKGLDAGVIKIEQLMMWLDKDKVNGPWHRYIWNPLKEAQHELNDDTKKVVDKIDALTKGMPKAWRKGLLDKVQLNGDPIVRTRKDLIGMALNLGNVQNREKMVNGNFGGNVAMVDQIKSRLTIEDWKFVHGIWNIINDLRPEIAAIEKRLTGLEPVWVEATPFDVTDAGGNAFHLEGGYYPLVADKHSGVGLKQEADIFEESYVYPVTSHGFTKTRTQATYPLDFNFDEIVQHHFVKVIKDYSHREAVLAANKILLDQDIRNTLISTLGEKYEPLFRSWLKDIANDSNRSIAEGMSTWGRLFTATRANVVAAVMGFKATTAISQIFGLSVSLDRVDVKPLTKAFLNYIAHPLENMRAAYDESGEMRHRANNIDRDIRQRLNAIIGKHRIRDDVQRVAFHGIAVADSMVAVITWHGAKQQALDAGSTREEAILKADAAVRLTQGAASTMDQSALVRDRGEFWRSITMFYSFFNALYSVGRDIGFQVDGPKDLPRALSRWFLAFVVPAILGEMLLLRGPGGDDDDEGYLGWAVRKALLSPLATIPLGRDMANAADFFLSNGAKGQFEIRFSPVATAVEKIGRLGSHIARDLTDDKDIDFIKYAEEVAEAVGFTFGVPGTAQFIATEKYLRRLSEGEEEPDNMAELLYEAILGKRKSK